MSATSLSLSFPTCGTVGGALFSYPVVCLGAYRVRMHSPDSRVYVANEDVSLFFRLLV